MSQGQTRYGIFSRPLSRRTPRQACCCCGAPATHELALVNDDTGDTADEKATSCAAHVDELAQSLGQALKAGLEAEGMQGVGLTIEPKR